MLTLTWANILRPEIGAWDKFEKHLLHYFFTLLCGGQLFYHNYLAISASFGVKIFYDMHYITFPFIKTS